MATIRWGWPKRKQAANMSAANPLRKGSPLCPESPPSTRTSVSDANSVPRSARRFSAWRRRRRRPRSRPQIDRLQPHRRSRGEDRRGDGQLPRRLHSLGMNSGWRQRLGTTGKQRHSSASALALCRSPLPLAWSASLPLTNISKLYAFSFLKMALFPMAIITLFWKDHIGLTLAQILLLQGIFSLATLLMEYPSGYLSDRFGYRFALTFASLLGLAGWSWYTIANSFADVLVAEVLLGHLHGLHQRLRCRPALREPAPGGEGGGIRPLRRAHDRLRPGRRGGRRAVRRGDVCRLAAAALRHPDRRMGRRARPQLVAGGGAAGSRAAPLAPGRGLADLPLCFCWRTGSCAR